MGFAFWVSSQRHGRCDRHAEHDRDCGLSYIVGPLLVIGRPAGSGPGAATIVASGMFIKTGSGGAL